MRATLDEQRGCTQPKAAEATRDRVETAREPLSKADGEPSASDHARDASAESQGKQELEAICGAHLERLRRRACAQPRRKALGATPRHFRLCRWRREHRKRLHAHAVK